MCGRYTVTKPSGFFDRFDLDNRVAFSPRFNAAPSQELPVITEEHTLELMRWGLIPHWAKDAKIGYSMINAKAETVAEKPSYKNPLRFQRCLIPADGFYEWKQTEKGKVPYYFRLKNGELFAFAGLYDTWKNPEGKEIKSYTIITTTPNELVGKVHDRMPVILRRDEEQEWLNPDRVEPEQVLPFLKAYPAEEMEDYTVSSFVNSVANDDPALIVPQENPQAALL